MEGSPGVMRDIAAAESGRLDGSMSVWVVGEEYWVVSEGSAPGAGRPRPMPRATIASLRAWIRCLRTSMAAFFLEKRIWRIASSIGFPAIWRARGASFFMEVLKKWDFESEVRSARASCCSLVRRPR